MLCWGNHAESNNVFFKKISEYLDNIYLNLILKMLFAIIVMAASLCLEVASFVIYEFILEQNIKRVLTS